MTIEWKPMAWVPTDRRILFRLNKAASLPRFLHCMFSELTELKKAYVNGWADMPANIETATLIGDLIRTIKELSDSNEEYREGADRVLMQHEQRIRENEEGYARAVEEAKSEERSTPGLNWRSIHNFPVPMTDRDKPILFYFPPVNNNYHETVHLLPYYRITELGRKRCTHWAYWDHTPVMFSIPNRTINAPIPVVEEEFDPDPGPCDINPETLDNVALKAFSVVMRDKMDRSRQLGRTGWWNVAPERLRWLLRSAVERGDPVDVANYAMMLSYLGEPTTRDGEEKVIPVFHYEKDQAYRRYFSMMEGNKQRVSPADRELAFYDGGFEDGAKWERTRRKLERTGGLS